MFMPFHVYEYVEYGKMYIFVVMLLWLSLIVAQKHESLSLVYETLLLQDLYIFTLGKSSR